MGRSTTALGALLTALATPATAEDEAQPTVVELPNLAVAPDDLGTDRKFYLFHKPGVSREQAEADLAFCWRFLARGAALGSGSFVPWRTANAPREATPNYDAVLQYGLTGVLIGALIDGPINTSIRQMRLYRCMGPRGYDRYRTSEHVWRQLNAGSMPGESIRMQAAIAAGPVPPTPRIVN